jgi:alpha-mannosidase
MNTLSTKLGLLDDDIKQEEKLFRLCADLKAKILTPIEGDFAWRYTEAELDAEAAFKADIRSWQAFTDKTVWAKKQGHTWFAAEVTVPPAAKGKTFVLRFSSQWQDRPGTTDPQCLAYLDGHVAQAIDGNHTELVIARNAKPGTKRTLLVNAFTFFDRPLVGFKVELLVRHERAEKLYFDLLTPLEVATRLTQIDGRRHAIMNLVEQSLRALDRRGGVTPEFEASLGAAEKIAKKIYELVDTEVQPTVSAVGHAHLDVGWLWRVMHTRDKTGRSFATVLALMAEYPQFVFMYNQSVLFDFLKRDYPEIWAGVVERVKSGQFEIEGAMWVEPDANIVSGESMVRQIMRGRRFHLEHFGVVPKTVWLPDTFGYSANMPQILARSGLEYFITSKLSWNDTDRHPYDTFFWRGIDGTRTKAQLITAQKFDSERIFTTYNSDLSVSEVMGAWKRYEPKSVNDEVLVCYGYGDGGGGPTRAMIERGTRLERGIPGAPKVKLEGIGPFLKRLSKRMDENAMRFPTWNGELYLQYHRGTLTNVAKNKANNRRAERVLRELEFLSAMAMRSGAPYPSEKLNEFWELVLINQFPRHPARHLDRRGLCRQRRRICRAVLDARLGQRAMAERGQDGGADGQGRLAAVQLHRPQAQQGAGPHRRGNRGFRFEPGRRSATAAGAGGRRWQRDVGGAGRPAVARLGLGLAGGRGRRAEISRLGFDQAARERADPGQLRQAGGEITSVFDKQHGRELIAAGETANRLVAYEDKPLNWDAWDIDRYFEEQFWRLSDGKAKLEVVETGPYRAALRIERQYLSSKVVQVVSLEAGSRQVEFDTFVDWQERQTVLKAEFPFDLNISEIRSEIQFGHVKRATHRNTSWDRARFEASMHRWVDISEPDFGAALLNDSKYGYDAVEQLVRITLLRGATFPDPASDRGEHRIKYALLVHDGVSDLADVPVAAERFNNPVAVIGDSSARASSALDSTSFSFASVDKPNVTLETVKKAEKSDALVLRVFEHANARATATISFGVPVKSAKLVNLMEEGGEPVAVNGNSVTLQLRPFEIATLLLELEG